MNKIRIMLIDDHPIVRQGIRSLLSNYPEFEIVGEADNGATGLARLAGQAPEVVLLDIRMPGESGLDILQQIRARAPQIKVIMLTSFDDEEYVRQALQAGAHGFVLKNASDELLVNAIHLVYRGGRVLSPQITEQVVQWALSDQPEPQPDKPSFSQEEQQILAQLAQGANNSQIAAALYLSRTTVKRRLRQIFAKLNVQSRAQAAAEAVRLGLV